MKRTTFTSFLALIMALLFQSIVIIAQVPQKVSYQAVIRNASGELVKSGAVRIRISILQGSASGTVAYSETHTATSNANGLITINVGNGTPVTGTFPTINWRTSPYFLKVETDPTGGTNYTVTGNSEIVSTPYALFAATSLDNAYDNGRNITADAGAVEVDGTDGVVFKGTFGSGTIPATGSGSRLMWYPRKAAFRVGNVNGTQWDNVNIGNYSFASGIGTKASGTASTAMGNSTTAGAEYSTAMGYGSSASNSYATAIGSSVSASGFISTALGYYTLASGDYSFAAGANTTASGRYSTALGYFTTASNKYSTALGFLTIADDTTSTAMGYKTTASGERSTAMGDSTIASGFASTAMGSHSKASGNYSLAFGQSSEATNEHSISLGCNSYSRGKYSTTLGFETYSAGRYGCNCNGV